MNRQTRVTWAAGFFDGEGCIGITRDVRPASTRWRGGSVRHRLRLEVDQIDMAPLLILKELFGGALRARGARAESCNPIYEWKAHEALAETALREMLPCLVVKQRQAELALEFRELVGRQAPKRYNHRGLAASELRERDAIRDAISTLNGGKLRPKEEAKEEEEPDQSVQLRLVV